MKGLEKDNLELRHTKETLNAKIIDLVSDHQTITEDLQKESAQKAKLEGLCRALQAERKSLNARLDDFQARLNKLEVCSTLFFWVLTLIKRVAAVNLQQTEHRIRRHRSSQSQRRLKRNRHTKARIA